MSESSARLSAAGFESINHHARTTGLQTTVGLGHGKFRLAAAGASNDANNAGLFSHVKVDAGLLAEPEKRVMESDRGAVSTPAFVSLVRKAVKGRWVEQGSMRNE